MRLSNSIHVLAKLKFTKPLQRESHENEINQSTHGLFVMARKMWCEQVERKTKTRRNENDLRPNYIDFQWTMSTCRAKWYMGSGSGMWTYFFSSMDCPNWAKWLREKLISKVRFKRDILLNTGALVLVRSCCLHSHPLFLSALPHPLIDSTVRRKSAMRINR